MYIINIHVGLQCSVVVTALHRDGSGGGAVQKRTCTTATATTCTDGRAHNVFAGDGGESCAACSRARIVRSVRRSSSPPSPECRSTFYTPPHPRPGIQIQRGANRKEN